MAVLGASSYSYAEASWMQTQGEAWCQVLSISELYLGN
jgi:hypothetical protein